MWVSHTACTHTVQQTSRLNVEKVSTLGLGGACGDNEPPSGTNRVAHPNTDQRFTLIRVKNGFICTRFLSSTLVTRAHSPNSFTDTSHHLHSSTAETEAAERRYFYKRCSYGSVGVYWPFQGFANHFLSPCLSVSWYHLLSFIVVTLTIQRLTIGARPIWLSVNEWTTCLHLYCTVKPRSLRTVPGVGSAPSAPLLMNESADMGCFQVPKDLLGLQGLTCTGKPQGIVVAINKSILHYVSHRRIGQYYTATTRTVMLPFSL